MSEKGKASKGAGRGSVGKKGGPASTPRVERKRAAKSDGASKSVPKVGKKETGRGDRTGGLH